MDRSFLFVPSCFLCLVGAIRADPIYTYNATSVIFSDGLGADTMSLSGSGFTISGYGRDQTGGFFPVGAPISPIAAGFSTFPPVTAVGIVDFGGISYPANVTGSVGAESNATFVIPSSGVGQSFPAEAIGEFTAVPQQCGPEFPGAPPCGVSVSILIDLPGEVSVLLAPAPIAGFYELGFGFGSTPVPEPSPGSLLFAGGAITGAVLLRRRKA